MANDNSNTPGIPQAQIIPLAKIHNLPGVTIFKQPDKSYGGLVTSIQAGGVKEPVILRFREGGEYELVTGYRRRRASELAKKQDIPALVYEMTPQEAIEYHRRVQVQPALPVPGKLISPPGKDGKVAAADSKETEPPTTGSNQQESPPAKETQAADAPTKDDKDKITTPKATDKTAVPAAGNKPQEPLPTKSTQAADDSVKDDKDKATTPKTAEKPTAPAADDKPQELTPVKDTRTADAPVKDDKGKSTASKSAASEKSKEQPIPAAQVAKGPAGTVISKVFDERLTAPDDKAKRDIPSPKEGESFFILLHPAYLEKSKYNTISVNQQSEDYNELKKSIELNGVKDPVLARIGDEGTLEILSGQRRHLIATELGYAVPTIIQKISDADAKILVADGNLHRPHISTYDLSRSLRMKMEGMKQKSGRRKKGTVKAEELDSDVKLAQEMGMSVSKLNRLIRLSEASKDVCDRVDDNSLPLSIASAISFLRPANQDEILHLSDLGYKVTNERVERMKKAEKAGKLNESSMREILEDKDIAPRQVAPPPAPQPSISPIPSTPDAKTEKAAEAPSVPAAPIHDTSTPSGTTSSTPEPLTPVPAVKPNTPPAPAASAPGEPMSEKTPFKGEQERPEYTKVVLAGDRLRKYFPDVSMTPREIEESVYDALEERRQRQLKAQQKDTIFQRGKGPAR